MFREFLFQIFLLFVVIDASLYGIMNTWSIRGGPDYIVKIYSNGTWETLIDVGHYPIDFFRTGIISNSYYYWSPGCSGTIVIADLTSSKKTVINVPSCIYSIDWDEDLQGLVAIRNASDRAKDPTVCIIDASNGKYQDIFLLSGVSEGIGVSAYVPKSKTYWFTNINENVLYGVDISNKKLIASFNLPYYIMYLRYDVASDTLFGISRDHDFNLLIISINYNNGHKKDLFSVPDSKGIIATEAYDNKKGYYYFVLMDEIVCVDINNKKVVSRADIDWGLYNEDLHYFNE